MLSETRAQDGAVKPNIHMCVTISVRVKMLFME